MDGFCALIRLRSQTMVAAAALILAFLASGVAGAVLAAGLTVLTALGISRLAAKQIGGQTGEVCGSATLLY